MSKPPDDEKALARQWRDAGWILRRKDPKAFRRLLQEADALARAIPVEEQRELLKRAPRAVVN